MRINVYVPDELVALAQQRHPSYNASRLFQESLRSLTRCGHEALECRACGKELLRDVVGRASSELLFREAVVALEALMVKGGSVEGAIRVLFDVARKLNVRQSFSMRVPRRTHAEIAAQRELEEAV